MGRQSAKVCRSYAGPAHFLCTLKRFPFILGRVMTKQCIKILMESDSANESALP